MRLLFCFVPSLQRRNRRNSEPVIMGGTGTSVPKPGKGGHGILARAAYTPPLRITHRTAIPAALHGGVNPRPTNNDNKRHGQKTVPFVYWFPGLGANAAHSAQFPGLEFLCLVSWHCPWPPFPGPGANAARTAQFPRFGVSLLTFFAKKVRAKKVSQPRVPTTLESVLQPWRSVGVRLAIQASCSASHWSQAAWLRMAVPVR